MHEMTRQEPWERLHELLLSGEREPVRSFLHALAHGETARTLSRLAETDQATLFELIGPEEVAALLEHVSDTQAVEIIEELSVEQAAAIVEELPSNERADLLGEMPAAEAEAILDEMEPQEAGDTRQLLLHAPHTAGGVMITEYLAYPDSHTVAEVVQDLREHGERYSDYNIQYAYIIDGHRVLVGVLRLRDLLLSRCDQRAGAMMRPTPLHVSINTSLDALKRLFEEHAFVGIPVTDERGRLAGVVRRAAVEEALGERAVSTYLKLSGLFGEEEIRTMPTFRRSSRRLSWLSINIVLNIIAASVIAFYQETLSAVIALAVFLPIISDMSGCSGNQAVAVSIRELALGLVKPYEHFRVMLKESVVGLVNGTVLGVLLGAVAVAWQGNVYLGLVVGGALMLNTLLAVLLGGMIPLALKRLRLDPALASGPILTTVTDMCGFFMALSFASVLLSKLSP